MADLKISEFPDGGTVQITDEIAAVRGGNNVKVQVGEAATLDADNSIGNLPKLEDVGGSPGLPAIDGSQLLNLPSSGGGKVVNQKIYRYTTSTSQSSCPRIDPDNSVPQNTEGKEWFSTTWTPSASGNKLIISGWGYFAQSDVYNGIVGAIFVSGQANALASTLLGMGGQSNPQRIQADGELTTTGTDSLTISYRAGPVNDGKDVYINSSNSGANLLGGAITSGFIITEVEP